MSDNAGLYYSHAEVDQARSSPSREVTWMAAGVLTGIALLGIAINVPKYKKFNIARPASDLYADHKWTQDDAAFVAGLRAAGIKNMTIYRLSHPKIVGLSGTNSADALGDLSWFFSQYFSGLAVGMCEMANPPNMMGMNGKWICDYQVSETPPGSLVTQYQVELNSQYGVYRACNLKGWNILDPKQTAHAPVGPMKLTKNVPSNEMYDCDFSEALCQCPCGNPKQVGLTDGPTLAKAWAAISPSYSSGPSYSMARNQPHGKENLFYFPEEGRCELDAPHFGKDGCTWRAWPIKTLEAECMKDKLLDVAKSQDVFPSLYKRCLANDKDLCRTPNTAEGLNMTGMMWPVCAGMPGSPVMCELCVALYVFGWGTPKDPWEFMRVQAVDTWNKAFDGGCPSVPTPELP